jgi:hypothetical protein
VFAGEHPQSDIVILGTKIQDCLYLKNTKNGRLTAKFKKKKPAIRGFSHYARTGTLPSQQPARASVTFFDLLWFLFTSIMSAQLFSSRESLMGGIY